MRFILATLEKDAPLEVFSEFFMRDKKNGIDRPTRYFTGDKHQCQIKFMIYMDLYGCNVGWVIECS